MAFILDASLILAGLNQEPGGERLPNYLDEGAICATTYVEVVTRLLDRGTPFDVAERMMAALELPTVEVTLALARRAAELRGATRANGLSMGDRICLATAESLGATAVTADRAWADIDVGISIELIR